MSVFCHVRHAKRDLHCPLVRLVALVALVAILYPRTLFSEQLGKDLESISSRDMVQPNPYGSLPSPIDSISPPNPFSLDAHQASAGSVLTHTRPPVRVELVYGCLCCCPPALAPYPFPHLKDANHSGYRFFSNARFQVKHQTLPRRQHTRFFSLLQLRSPFRFTPEYSTVRTTTQ